MRTRNQSNITRREAHSHFPLRVDAVVFAAALPTPASDDKRSAVGTAAPRRNEHADATGERPG
jgi:hypothetical protein